ncbi:MAG TPA: AIR synthase related protein, partial [Armatimonadota bacterium]|nr:AIR synthase related protein [Armatimonadota bacterium]
DFLTEPPRYDLPYERPEYLDAAWAYDLSSVPEPADYGAVLLKLLASPNICSKRWVWQQYDHMVQTNTVEGPGGDAAVLRIKEAAPLGVGLTIDGNSRLVYLDPYEGARLNVAEAARNLACVGAEPRIVTDGLNFGNPDKADRYYQFREAVRGIADACRQFDLAVVSGNVSFYNESPEGPIHPTPIIGMLGVIPDAARHGTLGFKNPGDQIWLLGDLNPQRSLAGSEYLAVEHGLEVGRPAELNVDLELKLQEAVRELVRQGLAASAHDCSDGGLAVTLAESCIAGAIGAQVSMEKVSAEALFGEAPSRVVVSVPQVSAPQAEALLHSAGVPFARLGEVGGERLMVERALDIPVSELEATWERTIPAAMSS